MNAALALRAFCMHLSPLSLAYILVSLFAPSLRAQTAYTLQKAYPNVQFPQCPVSLAFSPEKIPQAVVPLQRGMVHTLPLDRNASEAPVFLDFKDKLKEEFHFEAGFHSIVFHPEFATNRRVFLSYTQSNPRRNVLSEMTVPDAVPLAADPASERIIMEIPHQLADHYSGSMAFGPDGMLYYAVGDGGLRDDPLGMAQHPFLLQGKILRIDIGDPAGARSYLIPGDNPFVEKQEWRGEIYALGFRNPWGLSFDPLNGDLWAADVGQDRFEEINRVTRGGNYGWGERDGRERLQSRENLPPPDATTVFIDPVHTYSRFDGEGICIVGGMVYRGTKLPGLKGCYLYADWGVGKIWALPVSTTPSETPNKAQLLYQTTEPGFNPTGIFPDENGEPLVLNHHGWIGQLVEISAP